MIEVLSETQDNLLATIVSGKVEKKDLEKVIPILKSLVKQHGKIRWYYEMQDFEGWAMESWIKELKMDFKYANDIEKLVMVGDKKWEEWMTEFTKPFTSADVKYFDLSEKKEAKRWVEA